MAQGGLGVGEDAEVHWGALQARQLAPGVKPGPLAGVIGQGVGVAVLEIAADGGPAFLIVHLDEAPGLAVAHRRRQGRQPDQALDKGGRHRIGLETAHVAPPQEQLAQFLLEVLFEKGRVGHV
jgi:hypothetical protein